MSLINDALKRAKQVQVRRAPVVDPALEPAAPAANRIQPAWLISGGALALLVLACWFLFLSWRSSRPDPAAAQAQAQAQAAKQAAAVRAAVARLAETHSKQPPPPPAMTPSFVHAQDASRASFQPAPPAPIVTVQTDAAVPAESSADSAPQAPEISSDEAPPPPAPVEPLDRFKLQGIFYRSSRASALINGQTLFLGDEIDGAKLVAIERHAVRLSQRGQTNLLKLD
jgi:hypothetical protein